MTSVASFMVVVTSVNLDGRNNAGMDIVSFNGDGNSYTLKLMGRMTLEGVALPNQTLTYKRLK